MNLSASITQAPILKTEDGAFISCVRDFFAANDNPDAGAPLPSFQLEDLISREHENCEPDSRDRDHPVAHVVVWCAVREVSQEVSLFAALGLRRLSQNDSMPSDLLVEWCILADAPYACSYQRGLARSLALYPWLLASQNATARNLLDAGWLRRYPRTAETFIALPESRFACQMSSACCRADYGIALPVAAQTVIDAIPWDEIAPRLTGTRLSVRDDGQLQLKKNHESCRFLDEKNQCLIHSTIGYQPFGPCAVFPFNFARTPDGVAVSASFLCGSVRNQLGPPLTARKDLHERAFLADVRVPDKYRLARGMEIPWDAFRSIESALLDLLADASMPLHRRLLLGSRVLAAMRTGEPIDLEGWSKSPGEELSLEFRETLRTFLGKILSWDRVALHKLSAQVPEKLRHADLRDEELLSRTLRQIVFSKVYSYEYDLSTAHNMVILIYLLALIMQSHFEDKRLPSEMWQELSALGGHGLLKSLFPADASEGLIDFLGSAGFGVLAISYPADSKKI